MAQAISEAQQGGWRPRWHLWGAIALTLVALGGYRTLSEWHASHAFLINRTQSLPNWAFAIHKNKAPLRGDYLFFMPPRSALVVRHFGAKAQPFGKLVYGMPGDMVSHNGATVAINGKPVSQNQAG